MAKESNWSLIYNEYTQEKQGLREALCTLGNGYFATRGAFIEAEAGEHHYPGTYLAGGYNRLETEVAGRVIENEDLVNLPNWLCLNFKTNGGEWFRLAAVQVISFKQELDLKRGVLIRTIRFKDAHDRITALKDIRLVHMRHHHLAAIKLSLTPENWSGRIEVHSALDGNVINDGVARYRELNSRHLKTLDCGVNDEGNLFLINETVQSKVRIALAARHKLYIDEELVSHGPGNQIEEGYAAQNYTVEIKQGQTLQFEKVVSLYTSRDHAISEPSLEGQHAVSRAPGFEKLLESHSHSWKSLWGQFDIELEIEHESPKDNRPLVILRLHIFHLLQTVSYNTLDLDVGVPARGWHGEAYRGHIFWDELFILPLLNLRIPKISHSLLKYRYRRLDEARENARQAGFKGAMFPWQSGSNGREESQKVHLNPKSGRWIPDHSSIQRHVNHAIAYNCWRYFEVTNDMDFLRSLGAEMILEICRFLTSLCTYNADEDRYEIHNVMGPDEYHDAYPDSEEPGLNNNAYTNIMTVWIFRNALKLLALLPEDHHRELREIHKITDEEIEAWQAISRRMKVPFHDDGIISQFEGYENLEEFPWEKYEEKYEDIQRLDRILEAEGDTPNRYKVSKQADVLMLFFLLSSDELQEIFSHLGYEFPTDLIPKNIEYYLKRTSHGSTLSRIVHSWVLSREDRPASWNLFNNALESDIADIQGGTTPEGIHLGSMAGTVDIIQRCYSGIEPRGEVLWMNPCLPDNLERMRFHVHFRNHSLEVEMNHKLLKVTSKHSLAKAILLGFGGETHTLNPGESKQFALE